MKIGILVAAFAVLGSATVRNNDRRAIEPVGKYQLTIAGAQVDLVLDRATTVELNGKPVDLLLRAPKTRLFDKRGIRFEFPAGLQFRHDGDTTGVDIWTLTGVDAVVNVQQFRELSGTALQTILNESMIAELRSLGADITESEANLTLTTGSPAKVGGDAFTARLGGAYLIYEIYAFDSSHGGVAILLQDSRETEDRATDDFLRVKSRIENTLQFAE